MKRKQMIRMLIVVGFLSFALSKTAFAAVGWIRDDTGWRYDRGDGTYPSGSWEKLQGVWYYFGENGYMMTGWIHSNNNWYYCYLDGSMAENVWIEGTYYMGADGAMYNERWTPDGYYVGGDGAWIKDNSVTQYSEAELLKRIQSVCHDRIAEEPFVTDLNNDGKQEMIVQTFGAGTYSGREPWSFCYWYTDGEHTYSFGEESITGTIYRTEFSLIPTSLGADLVINMGWHPLAFGGYMDSAYIYRVTPEGAVNMFNRECCSLNDPQYESIYAVNYEFDPGMTNVKSREYLQINGNLYR